MLPTQITKFRARLLRAVLPVSLLMFVMSPVWSGERLEAQVTGQCTTIDPPCPPPPPMSVSVQSLGDTVRQNPVTVYFNVTGLTGGTKSASATVNGASTATPSWQLSSNRVDASGSVLANLATGTNTVAVSFCENGVCQSASTQVYYVVPPPPPTRAAPIVALDPMSQYQRTLTGCDGCAYATLGYSTPAYRSFDEDRGLTLIYSSGLSAPIGLVTIDVNPNSADLPSQISLSLLRGGVSVPLISGGSEAFYSAGSGTNRVTAAFDASGYGTGVYNMTAVMTAVVRNWWSNGMLETQVPVRVLIIRERLSGFGSGWSMAGLQVLSMPNGLSGDAAIAESGTMVAFPNCGSGCWSARPGSSESLVYVSATNTVERRYRDGNVATFDAFSGLLQRVSDRLGHSTSYLYDGYNRLTQVTDPAGLVTTIAWTGAPGTTSTATITTPGGRTTTLRNDASGQLIDITDPDGVRNLAVSYVANRISSATSRIGGTTTFTYDRFSALATATGPAVQTDDRGLATSTVIFNSRETASLPAVGYGSTSLPAPRVYPDSVWLRITTQRGDLTKVRANGAGDATLVQHIDALGKVDSTVITYDFNDRPKTVASTQGARLTYSWDNELPSMVADNVSHVTTFFTYNSFGQLWTTTVNQDVVEQNFYSTSVSRLDSTKAGTAVTKYTFDVDGRPLSVIDGEGHSTSFLYNSSGYRNLASVTNAGHTTQFAYDGYGRQTSVTDPLSRTSSVAFDAVNRPTTATAPNLISSTWAYNDATRQYSFTDARSQSYSSVLNAAGAVIQATDPRGLNDLYRYDSDGNLSSGTTRGSRTVTTVRDVLGRPTQITAGTLVTTIAYDPARKWTAYSNAEGSDTIFVDGNGRVVNQVAVRNGVAYQLRATFDSAGRRQTLNAESPLWPMRTLHFGYDVIDRQTFVEDFAGKGTAVAYNQDSRPQTITLPTSTTPSARVTRSFTYGSNDRLSAVAANQSQGVLNWSYAYDALDRAISLVQGNSDYSVERVAGYDNMGRLSQWSDTERAPGDPYTVCEDPTQIGGEGCTTFYPIVSTVLRSETNTYDAVGNRTDHGGTVQTGNRLTSFNGYTMTYDDDGNMLTKSGNGISQSFTWNGLGQLASVTTNGSTTAFGYDGLGRRVRKTTNGVSTYFLYDGGNIVMQLSSTGQPQLEFSYYPGVDQPHAVRQSSTGAIYYYITSQPGSVTSLVNSTGQVVNQYAYTPFGQTISATEQVAQPFRYTARQLDSETGLYYYRARYYDPAIARFVSEDPIGLGGGVNQYAYVGNDPIGATDPFGLCVTFSDGKPVCLPPIVVTAPYNYGWGWGFGSLPTNFGNPNAPGPASNGGSSDKGAKNVKACSDPSVSKTGMNLQENAATARSLARSMWGGLLSGNVAQASGAATAYVSLVNTGGPWDPKDWPGVDDFGVSSTFTIAGNVNFGVTCGQFIPSPRTSPVGYFLGAISCQLGAGIAGRQNGAGTSYFSGYFGDIPSDNKYVRKGLAIAPSC